MPAGSNTAGRPKLDLKVGLAIPGDPYVFDGVMEHFDGGEASITVDCIFQKDTQLRVEFHGFHFDGDVVCCERKNDGLYDIHVVMADTDESGVRRDPRYVVNLPALLHATRSPDSAPATLLDISKDGLGLESDIQLPVGETVAVESQLNLAFGIVRHSRQVADGRYRAGLQVTAVFAKEPEPLPATEKQPWTQSLLARLRFGDRETRFGWRSPSRIGQDAF